MPSPPAALQRKQYQLFIDRAPEAVFAFLVNGQNHARLCPAEMPEEILSGANAELADGSRLVVRAKRTELALTIERTLIWEVAEYHPPLGYALRQVEGPFKSWIHRRKLTPFTGGTLLADQIEYVLPGNPFVALAAHSFIGANMDKYYQHQQKPAKQTNPPTEEQSKPRNDLERIHQHRHEKGPAVKFMEAPELKEFLHFITQS
ncbi:MAG: hypothetical protein H7Y38_17985, partial [Armatimonadetes bacterium]|nr:hypothetical protein [Armatimonadota bacterium]